MRNILILEDLEIPRKRLVQILEKCIENVRLYECCTIAEALECAMKRKIDLFLVDIVLEPSNPSDHSGIAFAKNLRQNDRYISAEIIFITSLIGLEAKLLREIHCFDYIEKPITEERVSKTVNQALRKMDGICEAEDEVLFIRKERISYPLYTKDITCVESSLRLLTIYKVDDVMDVPYMSMNRFLEAVQTQRFIKPTKGMAINFRHIEYIDEINRYVKIAGRDELVEIGTRLRKHFMEEFKEAGGKMI